MHLKPLFLGAAIAALAAPAFAAEQTATFSVPGMTCASCPFIVQSAMSAVDGVSSVEPSLESKTARVVYDDEKTTLDAIALASKNAGYDAQLIDSNGS